jgi:hypothetical protein
MRSSASVDPITGEVASFPGHKDVTGSGPGQRPFLATRNLGTGEASIVYLVPLSEKDLDLPSEDKTAVVDLLERAADNARRASSRAAKNLRLFIVANCLTRMWTLTYREEQWDREAIMADVNDFLQKLRVHLGEDFPAVYVIEKHPKGHGRHVHIALQSRFIKWELLGQLWGHGWVQYSDGQKAVDQAKGKRAKARKLAGYLSKYMAKGWAEEHELGDHRYEVTQGFGVEQVRRVFKSLAAAIGWVNEAEGGRPEFQWSSDGVEDWHGPPAWILVYG